MDTLVSLDTPEHMRLRMLLPWHVNGSLNEAQAFLVRTHLHDCAACQTEVNSLQRLRRDVQTAAEIADGNLAARASLERFGHRLHSRNNPVANDTRETSRQFHSSQGRLRRIWQQQPRLALAACLLPVMVGLVISLAPPVFDAAYTTLSSERTPAVQADLVVVFDAAAPTTELDALLAAIHGRQVGEPNSAGAIRIALDRDAGAPDTMTVVALFRARPDVILAEPVAQP